MHSDFLDKFKGRANKIPKEGVANLIEATHKKPSKLAPSKPKHTNLLSQQKQPKTKNKQSQISPSNNQNKQNHHSSYSANELKRNLHKSINKSRQILSVKSNNKPLDLNINLKKQPLKLPKINKRNLLLNIHSVRQAPNQITETHLKQNYVKNSVPEKSLQVLKPISLVQVRKPKPQRAHTVIYKLENFLDDEALLHLNKLNNLELIVQQVQMKRRKQIDYEESHNSRQNRKGLTVHY